MEERIESTPVVEPTQPAERIVALDLLRGVAVLGILVMNIQAFAMVKMAYLNPTLSGGLDGHNLWIWVLSHLFADMKFLTLFSLLFGAGVMLSSKRGAAFHDRRMLWLIAIGAVHGYLLWHGDILVAYGLCGVLAYRLRRLPTTALLVIGLLLIGVGSATSISLHAIGQQLAGDEMLDYWQPSAEELQQETTAFRGGWFEQSTHRVPNTFEGCLLGFPLYIFWRVEGTMLIGMALYRLGVLSNRRSRNFYRAMVGVALAFGLPITAYGIIANFASDWSVETAEIGRLPNYWASLLVAAGWIGVVMLVSRSGVLTALKLRLASVGRVALSAYLTQTLICSLVFYGDGLALFGQLDRAGQLFVVVAVWIVLLIAAPWWLARYRFGPAEWLWRSLSYGQKQPLRREVST